MPINWFAQQLLKIGTQPIAFQLGLRYYIEKPDGGPDWGLRCRPPGNERSSGSLADPLNLIRLVPA